MELCIYHGIKVQVDSLEGERIFRIGWCRKSQNWWDRDRLNVWLCVKELPGRCYGELIGRLPYQLPRLFKIKLLDEDGASVEYLSVLALTT